MSKQEPTIVEMRLSAAENRLSIARSWKKRVDTMLAKRRKKDAEYSEARFCADNGFDVGFFNRLKNVKVVPTQKTVDLVEKALRKEGV